MLKSLSIENFAIINHIQLDFESGLSVITGETGAGKSILLDALSIVLGRRAQSHFLKPNGEKLSVTLDFNSSGNPMVHQWLENNDLASNDECILRRVIDMSGRSRSYINNILIPLAKLKELGTMLVDIVGQNTQQALMQKQKQLQILDSQCMHQDDIKKLNHLYQEWKTAHTELEQYKQSMHETESKLDFLHYQLKELEEFSPKEDEYATIEQEHKRLSNMESLMQQAQHTYHTLREAEDTDLYSVVSKLVRNMEVFSLIDQNLKNASSELEIALHHIQTAAEEAKHCLEHTAMDAETLEKLETRIAKYIELARKYQLKPEELPDFLFQLQEKIDAISNPELRIRELEEKNAAAHTNYFQLAEKISHKRHATAENLSKEVTQTLQKLNMQGAEFSIYCKREEQAFVNGIDTCEFMTKTNAGQLVAPMTQIASGGELSRISLAIQTALSKNHPLTTLIFDEVDAGVGGKTADTVARLLQKLSRNVQVFTITHLPQIAACANHHYFVDKCQQGKQIEITVTEIKGDTRDHEIARMLSGTKISDNTLAHARELLEDA